MGREHRDVCNLVLLAIVVSCGTEGFFVQILPAWFGAVYVHQRVMASSILLMASNYVDILAFVPALWRLYRVENELELAVAGVQVPPDVQRQVRVFLAFAAGFYF